MIKNRIYFDTIIRLASSLCLVIGALFSVSGVANRTISGIFLWIALFAGALGLVGSFFGKRSWYSGTITLLTTYLFMISRFSVSPLLRFFMLILVLLVSFGGLSNNFIMQSYSKKLFLKKRI